jgi:oligoribonuclease (3'-5' exoribonuclease)
MICLMGVLLSWRVAKTRPDCPLIGDTRQVSRLAFVDIETTGLQPEIHDIFEIALIVRDGRKSEEHSWWLPVDLGTAEPDALRLTQYYQRKAVAGKEADPLVVAEHVASLTAGAHLVGLSPAFDARFLERFLRRYGVRHAWHYHLVDVEALAAGKLGLEPPWSSDDLSQRIGVEPPSAAERHSALGDIRWTARLYDAVMHGGTQPMSF